MSDIFQHSENKNRIAKNIADSYSVSEPLQKASEDTVIGTPLAQQELVKSRIASSFNSDNALSSEELEKGAHDFLEKGGKRAVIGEKRTFGGREYIKTASGWKFHGKGTGEKAKGHAAGALDHHVEAGKGPVDHEKEAEKWGKELHTPTKLSHGMNMTEIDEKHAHHSRQAQLAAGTHHSQKKEEVGSFNGAQEYKKRAQENKRNVDANKREKARAYGEKNYYPTSPEQLKADVQSRYKKSPLNIQKQILKEEMKRHFPDHKEEGKATTSKHIGDMSATEMKAAADKLGIDTKGKKTSQVRKELTDANIDKQIADFKDKKKDPILNAAKSAITTKQKVSPLLKQSNLSSEEYSKAKHLKEFKKEDYKWDGDSQLYKKIENKGK